MVTGWGVSIAKQENDYNLENTTYTERLRTCFWNHGYRGTSFK